jgi:hypothetical protein|tara:strand:+ start:511 stop:882 length:372 start_codon:yes stop_codon:yes gene_type:complete
MVEKNLSDEQIQAEIEQLTQQSLEELDKGSYWVEMDENYFNELRERFQKGPDEIGPREFKTYVNKDLPIYMIVIPAGKQHNGEHIVQYFHTIAEDLDMGDCNGSYELITETELENKYNIIYFN